MRLTQQ
jgi:hypothetical protein